MLRSDVCRKGTNSVSTLPDRANNLPACINGVRGQIGTTIPFDKIAAIDNLHKFAVVSKVLKRLISQIGTDIKTAHTTIARDDGQQPIRLGTDFRNSHWSSHLIGNV